MSKQEELTKELIEASKEYYNNGQSSMSDIEFDSKVEMLRKMEKESGIVLPGSPTQNVGVKVDGLKTIKHEQPALSLDKTKYKDRESLINWIKNGDDSAVLMWKCDGCFSPDTKILMGDGTLKPIANIKIGDIVKSFDEKTKSIVNSPVKNVFNNGKKKSSEWASLKSTKMMDMDL